MAQHDSLHMMEGLQFCHCKCEHCWKRYATPSTSSIGSNIGRCICIECPCGQREIQPMQIKRKRKGKKMSKPYICGACGGSGTMKVKRGGVWVQITCTICHGGGVVYK